MRPYFAGTFESPNITLKSGRAWSATAIGILCSTRKCVNSISVFVTSVLASVVTNDVNGAVVFTVSDNCFVSVCVFHHPEHHISPKGFHCKMFHTHANYQETMIQCKAIPVSTHGDNVVSKYGLF